LAMSAYGPKQTWSVAMHMSAFGGKADMTTKSGSSPFKETDPLQQPFRSA